MGRRSRGLSRVAVRRSGSDPAAAQLNANGTALNVDAIADGQFLKRVGATIVGAAVSSSASQLDANGTTLDVDAITDGQFLKRVGSTIVSGTVDGADTRILSPYDIAQHALAVSSILTSGSSITGGGKFKTMQPCNLVGFRCAHLASLNGKTLKCSVWNAAGALLQTVTSGALAGGPTSTVVNFASPQALSPYLEYTYGVWVTDGSLYQYHNGAELISNNQIVGIIQWIDATFYAFGDARPTVDGVPEPYAPLFSL